MQREELERNGEIEIKWLTEKGFVKAIFNSEIVEIYVLFQYFWKIIKNHKLGFVWICEKVTMKMLDIWDKS